MDGSDGLFPTEGRLVLGRVGRLIEGREAGRDTGRRAGREAGLEAGRDAGLDGRDAGREAGRDAGREAGRLAPPLPPRPRAFRSIAGTTIREPINRVRSAVFLYIVVSPSDGSLCPFGAVLYFVACCLGMGGRRTIVTGSLSLRTSSPTIRLRYCQVIISESTIL